MVNTCSLSVCVHKVYSHAFIIQRQGTTIRGVESDAEPRHKLAACFFFLHFPSFFLFFSPTASLRLELNMSSVFTAGVGKTLGPGGLGGGREDDLEDSKSSGGGLVERIKVWIP